LRDAVPKCLDIASAMEKQMRSLTAEEKRAKLRKLARDEGFPTILSMLEATSGDSVSPAICTEPDCDYSTEMEPDQDRGWCDECSKNTMASALVLAGIV
jgi:hypothetical protein